MFEVDIGVSFVSDLIKRQLSHGGGGYVFVTDDPDLHLEFVLKLIMLGPKGDATRANNQKTIEKEIKVGMIVAKESSNLVSYSEIFEWEDFFCIKMEYCSMGNSECIFILFFLIFNMIF
jgi:serine/threonine protein kinase